MRPWTVGVAVAAALALASTAACDTTGAPRRSGDGDSLTIGVLLPETETSRYETFDRPLIERAVKDRCGKCVVRYANAENDVQIQHRQMDAMLTQGVDALILDPVQEAYLRSLIVEAAELNVPVVSYDRAAEGPISGYVSFDSDAIGVLQGEGLLDSLGGRADGARVVRVEGPLWNPHHVAVSMLEQAGAHISKTYVTSGWTPENAYSVMVGAIAELGTDGIDAVWAANDALAAGAVSALKGADIDPLPPVSGQDADLSAVQRIVSGEQYMTIYKPYGLQADAAVEMALALARGESVRSIATGTISTETARNVPSVELAPALVTVDTVKETVVRGGLYTIDEICTPKYRSACEKAGLID
ncbi:substrate-binding domain-containing protein [Streptomyces sp. OfavH-34-F]|uniref:substrate-binding domain-containing protein n=1 Tax=Streptomyces sp. OfavH-34-F TaxID=2917760 RepID=UPI001EF315F8|nr:substrate-binding domain-containing protein [Streptomyces sp. OfavH-34-F]MCG7523244.1 substrate-binding domain-containing protein [Streptomyces sp. OfavH-34-F]